MVPSIPSNTIPPTPSRSAATADAPSTTWEQCLALARKGPLSVARHIAGRHGPLQVTHGWMRKYMPEKERDRNAAGQALLALAGKSDVTDIREDPSYLQGTATLRESGDTVTYSFAKDAHGRLSPGAITSITVRTKDDTIITMGCWTPDVGGRVSLENDSDAATGATTKLPGLPLNVYSDYDRAADMWGWRP